MLHDAVRYARFIFAPLKLRFINGTMAQLYKIDHRRYSVQIPVALADEVDRLVLLSKQSASQVVVDQLNRALNGYGRCSEREMEELKRDQMTLLRAVPLSLAVLYGDQAKRVAAAMQLAEMIAEATTRKPTLQVAESPEKPPDAAGRSTGAGPRHRVHKSA